MKSDVDRMRRWGLTLVGAVFLTGAVVENLPGVTLPLAALRLWNDWSMFTRSGAPAIAFVVGEPRGGGEGVVIVQPAQRPPGLADRMKGARERKLHEALARPAVPVAVRQSYLAHVCEGSGERYERLELRVSVKEGATVLLAERKCP